MTPFKRSVAFTKKFGRNLITYIKADDGTVAYI
jgi:hypothetical protein